MKHKDHPGCDPSRLNRFRDGELSSQEKERVSQHLVHCPACRQRLDDDRFVAETIRSSIDTAESLTDFEASEARIIQRLKTESRKRTLPLKRVLFSRPFYLPASGLAAAMIALLIIYHPFKTEPVPSALINSFTGHISSAMIIETPKTHHTILWFSEDSVTSGEENAAHQT